MLPPTSPQPALDEATLTRYITSTFVGVHAVDTWGDTFFFYNPDRSQPDSVYFATLKSKDDGYDRASDLDRQGIFRLNIGVSRTTYRALFGAHQPRPGQDATPDPGYDFTALDRLLPHPVYIPWVCVLNPSPALLPAIQPLLAEAYDIAVSKYAKRVVPG